MSKKQNGTGSGRLIILGIIFLIMFAVLIYRFFYLQVIRGEDYQQQFQDQVEREEVTTGSRGRIYDRNGVVLARNQISYMVTIEDDQFYETEKQRNNQLNEQIARIIGLLEEQRDYIENQFPIEYTSLGGYRYTVEGFELERFRADVFGHANIEELEYNEQLDLQEAEATAAQIVHYLRSDSRFDIGDQYPNETALKITAIRYAMSLNSYQRYIPTVIARDISESSMAAIAENEGELSGIEISEEMVRRYDDSIYFANILGYTGQVSVEQYEELSGDNETYTRNDTVGQAGLESFLESDLRGENGIQRFYVDSVGRVTENLESSEPQAGNDVYLTIDANLQMAVYQLLEQQIAGIVLANIVPGPLSFGIGETADEMRITSDDVYFALVNNGLLDIMQFDRDDAGPVEQALEQARSTMQEEMLAELPAAWQTDYNDLNEEMQRLLDYVIEVMNQDGMFQITNGVLADEIYQQWQNGEISLSALMSRAIESEWIDLSHLDFERRYVLQEEIHAAIQDTVQQEISRDREFSKVLYELMIKNGRIDGSQIVAALYEQGILENQEEYNNLTAGEISAYDLIRSKIRSLEITPAQLALDPSTGSSVITDPDTGEVLACVTYPGYDNNRLANTVDSDYYNQLLSDGSLPLYNNATQQTTAPGSTFKPVTAAAGLSEGVISRDTVIEDLGVFEKVTPSPRCWIYPGGTHGAITVSEAIRESCNYFFYETAFRLSGGTELNGEYRFDDEQGTALITEYAENFGLGQQTGLQLEESEPQIADEFPITAAIGQSNHSFTTTQLARYTATLANSGNIYNLNLVSRIENPADQSNRQSEPELAAQVQGVSAQNWEAIRSGMEMMAAESDYFTDLPFAIAGKTGTAEQVQNRPNHALFVGYAPADRPEIAVATRIAYGYSSSNAAEVSANIFKYYFNTEEAENLLTGTAAEIGVTGNVTGD